MISKDYINVQLHELTNMKYYLLLYELIPMEGEIEYLREELNVQWWVG
jgi:hypothetical protein